MATQHPSRGPQPLTSDVQQAEQCDAAGAHGDAITHLAAGARKHNVEALTRLGKRLLVGDRAPCLPKDGAGLIAEASTRGGAEAGAGVLAGASAGFRGATSPVVDSAGVLAVAGDGLSCARTAGAPASSATPDATSSVRTRQRDVR